MTTNAYRILTFKSVIEKPIAANHTFFAFSKINSFTCVNSIVIQKAFYQDNLSYVCLKFYKHDFLNILPSNICCRIQTNTHLLMLNETGFPKMTSVRGY